MVNVLSLFDGISCGQIALSNLGADFNYYCSEIDKYSMLVTQSNFPDSIHLGDVENYNDWDLPKIDLLIGGSPCQGFSHAGKGLNFEDPRSKLFFTFVEVLEKIKPKYFLLENVPMKQEYKDVITSYLSTEPVVINSNIFVPHNRKRLYWTNIPIERLPAEKDRSISDILQDDSEVEDLYYLTERQLSKLNLDFEWSNNKIKKHKGGRHQQDAIYHYSGIMGCLSAATHGAARHLTKTFLPSGRIRRLTEIECERLQGVPDDYTSYVSSSKRYESLGNGWTVPVIEHIFKGIK